MVIVSQERNMTTECLELEIIDRDIGFAIYSYGLCEDIGIYNTKERAKEVLKEILEAYKNCNYYSLSQMGKGFVINDYYEMPEE